jgi:hypothetical protein
MNTQHIQESVPSFINTKALCETLHIKYDCLAKLIKLGFFKPVPGIGKCRVFPVSQLIAYANLANDKVINQKQAKPIYPEDLED